MAPKLTLTLQASPASAIRSNLCKCFCILCFSIYSFSFSFSYTKTHTRLSNWRNNFTIATSIFSSWAAFWFWLRQLPQQNQLFFQISRRTNAAAVSSWPKVVLCRRLSHFGKWILMYLCAQRNLVSFFVYSFHVFCFRKLALLLSDFQGLDKTRN